MSFVYILESLRNGKYYIGSTEDIEKRLQKHNSKQVCSTKSLAPFRLVFKHECIDKSEARKFEAALKKLKRRDYLQKIIKSGKLTFGAFSSSGRASDS